MSPGRRIGLAIGLRNRALGRGSSNLPWGTKGDVMENETSRLEIMVAFVAGILLIACFVLMLGCATKQPSSHEDWAAYCMSKKDSEFKKCLDDWNHWETCTVK